MNKKALIAMSGGVDSSVAAASMVREGYTCFGVTMRLYQNEDIGLDREGTCCSLDDVEDARSVARMLGMPFYVFNFTEDFAACVMDRFVRAYECGDTPNPCIDCNRYMKFEKLYERAKLMDCDTIVTGHYARIEYSEPHGRYLLKRARDLAKDQSYVLYFLSQEQLAHTRFPLGSFLSKEEVREWAETFGFRTARKHDSQDICFVPDGDYTAFIERRTQKEYPAGDLIDVDGNVLGRHRGIVRYTIGQRKGLGIALGEPMYVKEKSVERNTVTLARDAELLSDTFIMDDVNLIDRDEMREPIRAYVKSRYRAKEAAATVTPIGDGRFRVTFDEPQRALTTGQAAVMYDGDVVIGGGTIRSVGA